MLISYIWLQEYFDEKLPTSLKIKEALTMHAFEVESVEEKGGDFIFDIKVLPDRSHDSLSHFGIAIELSSILNIKLDKNKTLLKDAVFPESNVLRFECEAEAFLKRFSLILVEGIEVKESPKWLKERIESIGQKSINNIVDATNFVMFSLGQPLHAYDADKLSIEDSGWKFVVRYAKEVESFTALDGKEYSLNSDAGVIVDGNSGKILGLAGIKGGKESEINKNTKKVILEAGNFNAVSIRKTSKALGLRTDASVRFENEITSELTTKALEQILKIIIDIAGTAETRVEGILDWYERKPSLYKVGASLQEMEAVLGISLSEKEVGEILSRRGFEWEYLSPREKIINGAKSLLGVPYKFGSSVVYDAPRSFDCSSFTSFLYAQSGMAIPRISVDQYVFGEEISFEDAKPGDLIFSNSGNGQVFSESVEWLSGTKVPAGVDHVGIYMGEGKVIHATKRTGSVVEEELLKDPSFKNTVGFRRMGDLDANRFVVTVPSERLDLRIKEDLIEEIGRTYGYENIVSSEPIESTQDFEIHKPSLYSSLIRKSLTKIGFSEVITYAFLDQGEVELLNPLASDKSFLRDSLSHGLKRSLEINVRNSELLGLTQIKIFEIGRVFKKEREFLSLGIAIEDAKGHKGKTKKESLDEVLTTLEEFFGVEPHFGGEGSVVEIDLDKYFEKISPIENIFSPEHTKEQIKFKPFSQYPFVLRDIAVFVPEGVSEVQLEELIREESGNLLVRTRLFDEFTKEFPDGTKKTSFAFRLVFQSEEKTLTDEEVNVVMDKLSTKILDLGWEVR